MKISNEQIIASARRQRQKVLNAIDHSSLNIDHWATPGIAPSKNNGQQSTVNSQRSMVNGQWSMVNGQRSTVNGQCSMVNGQRSTVNGQWSMVNGQWWAVAASLVSFFAGYALHAYKPQSQHAGNPVAQVIEVQHDTIMQVQTVRDTIYETRIVTKYEPMLAKADASPEQEEDDTPPEQKACSMLCDDIPYELLAAGR